jgi:glycosyltransferase involved in cell wall biosynthesis
MRIALVTTEYITEPNFAGGLANYTYRVARGLRKLGHDPEVLVYGETSDASFEHDGITVHRLKVRAPLYLRALQCLNWRLRSGPYARDIYTLECVSTLRAGLKRRHRERPFDVVHYTHLQGTGAMRTHLPSVVRLSSYRDLCTPFGFQFTSPFERFLEDLALKRADAIFGPSEWVVDFVRSKLNRHVAVIESPFVAPRTNEDPSIWETHLRSCKRYALYFGSIAEWKGVFVLSEALKTILPEYTDLHFVMVGRDLSTLHGKPASQFILQELAAFKERVIRFDAIPHAQLFPIIRNAEFVTLPSLADNLPNTCLEAMALGKVVIGTRGRSFDQLIQDGASGLICEPNSVPSLINAIRRAATMCPADKEQIGRRAQDRIHGLAPDRLIPQLVAFYKEVINRKRNRTVSGLKDRLKPDRLLNGV